MDTFQQGLFLRDYIKVSDFLHFEFESFFRILMVGLILILIISYSYTVNTKNQGVLQRGFS